MVMGSVATVAAAPAPTRGPLGWLIAHWARPVAAEAMALCRLLLGAVVLSAPPRRPPRRAADGAGLAGAADADSDLHGLPVHRAGEGDVRLAQRERVSGGLEGARLAQRRGGLLGAQRRGDQPLPVRAAAGAA